MQSPCRSAAAFEGYATLGICWLPYVIFGDMNQQARLSGPHCDSSQNGRGGLFFVVQNPSCSTACATCFRARQRHNRANAGSFPRRPSTAELASWSEAWSRPGLFDAFQNDGGGVEIAAKIQVQPAFMR